MKLRKDISLSAVPLTVLENSNQDEFSLENMGQNSSISSKDKYDRNCAEAPAPNNRNKQLCFSKIVSGDRAMWTFFLNVECCWEKHVNAFIVIMSQVKSCDTVFIHGPAYIERHYAEAIHSVISSCPAKVYMSNPYVLCCEAAYLLTAADFIISSPYMHMRLDSPSVGGYGRNKDAFSSLSYEMDTYARIYKTLIDEGFLLEDEYNHIKDGQGMIMIETSRLLATIMKYNAKRKAE